jgi:predicted phage terminase large subunit-like protein
MAKTVAAARIHDPIAEDVAFDALIRALNHNPREVIRPLPDIAKVEDEAEEMALSLRKFIPGAWPAVEPAIFIPNWHIDAIAEHLEAVSAGDILDLLITMPPRHSKSLLVSVLWPVWEWLQLPSYRWVFASYSFTLSLRDSVKRRTLLRSPWFMERWADRFTLLKEQNTKIRYENDHHGFMLASSVGGSNTGEGGERIIADDPHNIKKIESEDVRIDTVNWWNIVMSTRRNTLTSARVVVQQRVHEADVAGDIMEKGGYVHLNLPTEFGFGGGQRCKTGWTVAATGLEHHWEDPRQEVGELLNPKRFDTVANDKAKITLGDYQYAAQHGQNPTPPSGSIIQRAWLRFYGGPTPIPVPDWLRATNPMTPLLSLDCTFKDKKDTDYVAGLGWAQFGSDIYLMPQCIHDRLSFTGTIDALAEMTGGKSLDGTKKFDGIYPFLRIKLVEDKANGSAVLDTMRHQIPGMVAYEPGNNSKEARLQAASWRFRAGNIYLPHPVIAPWVNDYIYELCAFPKARRDDYVDSTSQALLWIGGDPNEAEGAPAGVEQESTWMVEGLGMSVGASGGDVPQHLGRSAADDGDPAAIGGDVSKWKIGDDSGNRRRSRWRM